eukprot:567790-Pyramimonas_sp.AAC.1
MSVFRGLALPRRRLAPRWNRRSKVRIDRYVPTVRTDRVRSNRAATLRRCALRRCATTHSRVRVAVWCVLTLANWTQERHSATEDGGARGMSEWSLGGRVSRVSSAPLPLLAQEDP